MWYGSSYLAQANAMSKMDKYNRKDYRMAWMIFAMSLTVPFVPFALIAAWRLVRHYLFTSGATSGSSARSDVAGAGARGSEDSTCMPGTCHSPLTVAPRLREGLTVTELLQLALFTATRVQVVSHLCMGCASTFLACRST
jgi:hypothetical protein